LLHIPQSSQTTEQSPPAPWPRKLCLAAHPAYACGMACARERKEKSFVRRLMKQPQLSEMAVVGTLALRCCFSEQSCFQEGFVFCVITFRQLARVQKLSSTLFKPLDF